MIPRHKVFISYYHNDDQSYKNQLIQMKEFDYSRYQYLSIFDDYSVHENEIDDNNGQLSAERIRCIIRDEYIKDASVLILLCGQNTRKRKHIDWEIHAAMFDTQNNPKMGILIINMPTISQGLRVGDDGEKSIVSPYGSWRNISTRQEIEEIYPYLPSRIIDNLVKGVPITIVDWNTICNNLENLKRLIDNAYNRRNSNNYDHSTPLRRTNS